MANIQTIEFKSPKAALKMIKEKTHASKLAYAKAMSDDAKMLSDIHINGAFEKAKQK